MVLGGPRMTSASMTAGPGDVFCGEAVMLQVIGVIRD
jgi:hypothetical protein